jgi:alpha,alpha-trehalose phosphorylase (configuration-retaining)
MRRNFKAHELRKPGYAGVVDNKRYCVAVLSEHKTTSHCYVSSPRRHNLIASYLDDFARDHYTKVIAATLSTTHSATERDRLGAHLWLSKDIVPLFTTTPFEHSKDGAMRAARAAKRAFTKEGIAKVKPTTYREVIPAWLVRLSDYKKIATPHEFTMLKHLAGTFKKRKLNMIFINATAQGGGVAIMRHTMIRLYRLLGLDIHWYVLQPNAAVFEITKRKFHNILQGVAATGIEWTKKDHALYNLWIQENLGILEKPILGADVIVIDDPQPSGLIPHIKKLNPNAKILYRSHIQLESSLINKKGTPSYEVWKFLWENIKSADVFISHPIKQFVPATVEQKKLVYMPPTTDQLDGLNKPLKSHQLNYYLTMFNNELNQIGQTPLDTKRDYLIQIARFDPSKGIPDLLRAYAMLRHRLEKEGKQHLAPQLVITGHGSIDDPEGMPIFNATLREIHEGECAPYANDIKVARLPHSDQLLNALLRKSKIALQLSIKEGFEFKVTESLAKGKPVIAYRTGGIPLQIEDGKTGYLVDRFDVAGVAKHLYTLLTNDAQYNTMSANAVETLNSEYFTISNAINWLYLALTTSQSKDFEGNGAHVSHLRESRVIQ